MTYVSQEHPLEQLSYALDLDLASLLFVCYALRPPFSPADLLPGAYYFRLNMEWPGRLGKIVDLLAYGGFGDFCSLV